MNADRAGGQTGERVDVASLHALLAGPEGLTKFASTFTRKEVVEAVADEVGDACAAADVERLVDGFLASGMAKGLSPDGAAHEWVWRRGGTKERDVDLARWSTPELLGFEADLERWSTDGLGAPPADVDTTIPVLEDATERQRIESVTTAPTCAGCHSFINPFGFMQENYDAIGRYRTTDAGQPIDASISVDFLDEGPFSASTAVEALAGFTRSWRFQQCFARQIFRFYMGRDEDEHDDPLLRKMFLDFASQDAQDLTGMLRTLAGSTSFSDRSEAP